MLLLNMVGVIGKSNIVQVALIFMKAEKKNQLYMNIDYTLRSF